MINKFFKWLGLLFFFLMLVIPTTYQTERGLLLSILVIGTTYKALAGKWKIHKNVLVIGIGCITSSLLFMLYGLLNDAPGAVDVGTVFVLWPILFVFFMGILNKPIDYVNYIKIIVIGVIVAAVMAIMVVVEGAGLIDIGLIPRLVDQGAQIGIFEGRIEYSLKNMTTIIFGFPFLMTIVLLPEKTRVFNSWWNKLALFSLVLALISLLISGRRAYWVVAAATPIIISIIFKASAFKTPFKLKNVFYLSLFAAIFTLTTFTIFKLNIGTIIDDILAGFEFTDTTNLSAYLRNEQYHALLDGWMNSPLFGSGHGAAALGSIRSERLSWAYELTYLALLFQIGIVGTMVYSSALLWTYAKSFRFVRMMPEAAALLLPLLVGLTGFLIANASNPYLAKFDYLWTIFLPVGILNAFLLANLNERHHRKLEHR